MSSCQLTMQIATVKSSVLSRVGVELWIDDGIKCVLYSRGAGERCSIDLWTGTTIILGLLATPDKVCPTATEPRGIVGQGQHYHVECLLSAQQKTNASQM